MTKWVFVLVLGAFALGTAGSTVAQGCDPCPAPPKGSLRPVTSILPG